MLLDIFFFEEIEIFFISHYYNEDFIERSDKSYDYKNSSGNNYFISKTKIDFQNISDESSNDRKNLKYNATKDVFEEE